MGQLMEKCIFVTLGDGPLGEAVTDQADRIENEEGSDSIDVRLLRSDIEQLINDALDLNRRIRELQSEPPNQFLRLLQSPAVQYQ